MNLKNKYIKIVIVTVTIIFSLVFINNKKTLAMNIPVHVEYGKSKIILIDPGHGGIDGGAVAKDGTLEKDINLKIAKKLNDKLKKLKYNVLMTRENDKSLNLKDGSIRSKKVQDLKMRCQIKEKSNCDIFISIHLNMFPQSKYNGAQVWYGNNEKSKILGNIIQENIVQDLNKQNKRKEKPAKNQYRILKNSKDRAEVIIECGFLSNEEEKNKLKTDEYQNKIADSLVKSINQYFSKL